MSRRERVEDLGRIAEISNGVLELPFFKWDDGVVKSKVSDEEGLCQLMSQIAHIQERVDDIYEIARWGDNLVRWNDDAEE